MKGLIWIVLSILLYVGCAVNPVEEPDYSAADQFSAAIDGQITTTNNNFAFKSFSHIIEDAEEDANVFYSPLSVSIAMAMLFNGAAGSSADAILSGMEFPGLTLDEINSNYYNLTSSLERCDADVQLNLANSLWIDSTFEVRDNFRTRLRYSYRAEDYTVDLQDPAALLAINNWVSEKTAGKIPKMYDTMSRDALLVLLNALYFKANWKYQFDPENTADAPFHNFDGTTSTVKMMTLNNRGFKTGEGDNFTIARLPYGRDVVAMYVVLPNPGVDVDAVMDNITTDEWNNITAGMQLMELTIALPKFKIAYEINLKDILIQMGMEVIFTPAADLSGIAGTPGELMVLDARQKTYVDVNEQGTEAAAVTGITVGDTSAPEAFIVDRPFAYVIMDDRSGTILFLGRVKKFEP